MTTEREREFASLLTNVDPACDLALDTTTRTKVTDLLRELMMAQGKTAV